MQSNNTKNLLIMELLINFLKVLNGPSFLRDRPTYSQNLCVHSKADDAGGRERAGGGGGGGADGVVQQQEIRR